MGHNRCECVMCAAYSSCQGSIGYKLESSDNMPHWNPIVVMIPTLSSMVALEVFTNTTFAVTGRIGGCRDNNHRCCQWQKTVRIIAYFWLSAATPVTTRLASMQFAHTPDAANDDSVFNQIKSSAPEAGAVVQLSLCGARNLETCW